MTATAVRILLNGKPTELSGPVVTVRDVVTLAGKDHREFFLRERIAHKGRHHWIGHRNRSAVLDCRREAGRERWFETEKA